MGFPRPTKIASLDNLLEAWNSSPDSKGVGKAPGIDRRKPVAFGQDLYRNLQAIRSKLLAGPYEFSRLRPIPIRKSNSKGYRIICIPTVENRLVQRLIGNYLNKGDKLGIHNSVSYGFIAGRGTSKALRKATRLRCTHPWAFKSDITSFFDTIDRTNLTSALRRRLGGSSIVPHLGGLFIAKLLPIPIHGRKLGKHQLKKDWACAKECRYRHCYQISC